MSAPSLYTSAATSRALAEAGLPQMPEHGVVAHWHIDFGRPPLMALGRCCCVSITCARAWRLDELLALLKGWTIDDDSGPGDTCCRAYCDGMRRFGDSPVEAVAALVLAVRGASRTTSRRD